MGRKRKANRDLPERVYQKHGAYYFVTPEGKWIRLGVTKGEMYRMMAELELRPAGGYTVTSLWNDYQEDELSKLSPATARGYIKSKKKLLETFGHMGLDQIKPSDVARYLLLRGKKAPTSANREIAILSTMYTYAVRLGLAEMNPCLRVKRIKTSPRTRYVEDWELAEFLSVCDIQLQCYVELKYLTGLRKTDMLSMTLMQIKDSGLYVHPSKTKNSTGEIREFIWTPALRDTINRIKSLPRLAFATHLFCDRNGRSYIDEGLITPRFDQLWRKTMKRALQETNLKERFQERDIRAKTATDADDSGQNATEILGHGNSLTTKIYIRSKQIKRVMPLSMKLGDKARDDEASG
ncbi:MAG: tyrosine-type recombinase/integrase [Sedimenticola sp.]